MRRFTFLLIAGLCVLTPSSILVAQSPSLTPFHGLIDHVSADQWGGSQSSAEVWHHAISGDGRYVVFNSPSSYLSAGDNEDYNGYDDIFLRDRMTGTTTRISRPLGAGAGDGISQMGTISTNGRHVAFASGSSNLVAGDTNDHWDVFVRDLDQQRTVRVSVATNGTQGDRDAYYPSISADGRFVAFLSWATTFAPGVSSSAPRQLYLHDRDADGNGIFDELDGVTTELISAGLTGDIANQSIDTPHVTSDGGHVLFESAATNLTGIDNPNGLTHLYRRDRQTGQTEMIDRAVTGGPSAWGVGYGTSDMSDDGRFITFSSISNDIVPFVMNWQSQVFLFDTLAGPAATTIVSRLQDGTLADGSSYASSVSADGRYVLFTTAATNLAWPAPIGADGPAMLAVRDMTDGSFTRVDVLDWGQAFDQSDYYYTPAISADGTAIVLQSRSQYALNGGYSNGASHAFVLAAFSASPTSASYPAAGGNGSIEVNTTAVSGWNAFTPYDWIAVTEGGGFGAGPRTVQYQVAPSSVMRDGWILVGSKYINIHQDSDSGDTTPPIVTATVTGTQVNGWYTSDITVTWSVTDPQSEIISQNGCATQTFTTDSSYFSTWCEATSQGGTNYQYVPLRRDTTPPSVVFAVPTQTIYAAGSVVTPFWYCNDGSGSGVQTCALTQGSSPLDTTPGRHVVTVTATDNVGFTTTKSVEYLVGSNVCVTPSVAPTDHMKLWVPLDTSDYWRERVSGDFVAPMLAGGGFQQGVVGQAWFNSTPGNYVMGSLASAYTFAYADGVTVAAWVNPIQSSFTGTIVSNPLQYRVARFPDGTLRWAFNQSGVGFVWRNTGIVIPSDAWSHVAVTFKNGNVRSYLNGRLVSNAWVFDYILTTGDPNSHLTIAGRADASESLLGAIDDVMLFNEALTDADIESIALAGGGSLCVPNTSTITLTAPSTVAYGTTFPVTALLTDGNGIPLPNRQIEIGSRVSPDGSLFYQWNTVTNASGTATVQLPVSSSAMPGYFANAVKAFFPGDVSHQPTQIIQGATLVAGTPTVTWSPASSVYGTGLAASQLNATANVPGTFTYSPAAGTILDAGNQTLSVTFTPDNTSQWAATTQTATLVVNKATPTVTATGGTFTYDNQPHAGSGAAVGALGETLTPVTLTYDGSSSTPPTSGGAHTVRASYAGSANYLAAQSADATLTINRATPTVDWDTTTVWYTGYARTALVFVRGIGGVELNPITVRYNGSTTGPVNAGTYPLEVQFAGNSNYAPITATTSFVIRKNFPIFGTLNDFGETYDGQPHGINVNIIGVQNELLTPVITTYNGSTAMPVNADVYTVVVRYDGSANYEADSRTFTMTIFKAAPYLQWVNPESVYYGTPLGANQLRATSNVVGAFTYVPPAGTILNAGSHTLTATFTPNDTVNYQSGSLSRPMTVSKSTAYAVWYRPANIVYGTPLSATQLNATAPVPGTFTYSPTAGTVLPAGVDQILHVTFTPDDSANYDGSSVGVPLTVDKAVPVVSWNAPADIVYGTALSASQLNATANVAGTFSYSPALGTVLGAGPRTLSVTFTPTDTANYTNASANVSLTVTKAASTISWPNPASITYGLPLSATQLNASANVPGSFVYSPASGTILGAGTQQLSVTFTPDDSANYASASANATIVVSKVAPALSWSSPPDVVYGTALSSNELNATVNAPGTLTYSPALGAVLGAGSQTLSVTFTPDDPANYNGATASVTLNVTKAPSILTWPEPAGVAYGTALGASQLNATANVPGTFSYSPAAGAILAAGPRTLTVTFTPTDAANYAGASASVLLNVTKAVPVITWPNPGGIVYGTPLGASQLNATSNVAGTLVYLPAAGAILSAGSQILEVTFTPDDPANYTGAIVDVTINVTKAASTITWPSPSEIVYGTALSGTQLNAAANVAGTFAYSPAAGTVLNAGSRTLSVTFTPSDSMNYNGATASVTLNVAKATPVVSWSNPAGITYGTALSGTQLNAAANVPGSFAYSPAAGAVLGAGTQQLSVTFTPNDSSNYTGATANVSIAIAAKALTVQTNNATKVYGAALPAFTASGTGFVNGDSMSSLSGTLSFSTTATATSAPGSYAVTPSGVSSANYTITFAAGTLTINKAATSLTFTTTPNPSTNNQTVQLRAVVSAVAPGAGTATGTVEFRENGTLLGTATLVNGVATMNKSFKRGTHPLTATYAGDTNFTASSGSVTHQTQ